MCARSVWVGRRKVRAGDPALHIRIISQCHSTQRILICIWEWRNVGVRAFYFERNNSKRLIYFILLQLLLSRWKEWERKLLKKKKLKTYYFFEKPNPWCIIYYSTSFGSVWQSENMHNEMDHGQTVFPSSYCFAVRDDHLDGNGKPRNWRMQKPKRFIENI